MNAAVSQQPGAPRLTSLEPPLSPVAIGAEPPLSTGAPLPLLRAADLPATAPPAPKSGATRIVVQFRSGEQLPVGVYDTADEARSRAKELVAEVQAEDNWLFVDGRSISSEEIERIFLDKRSS